MREAAKELFFARWSGGSSATPTLRGSVAASASASRYMVSSGAKWSFKVPIGLSAPTTVATSSSFFAVSIVVHPVFPLRPYVGVLAVYVFLLCRASDVP